MFGEQAMRLLRTRWKSAQDLAEELFAMMNNDIPLTTNAPFTISLPEDSTQPALTLKNPGEGPFIKFQGPGGKDLGAIDNNGDLVGPLEPGQTKPTVKNGGGTTVAVDFAVYMGVVVGGSGSTYTMQIEVTDGTFFMENGIPKVFTVTQKQIDPSATIPVGTWAMVLLRGGKYSMQVPVWLGS